MAGAPKALVVGKAEDGQALAEFPKVLLPGAAEGLGPRIPEVVTKIAEQPPAVAETPEAVNPGIHDGPTS